MICPCTFQQSPSIKLCLTLLHKALQPAVFLISSDSFLSIIYYSSTGLCSVILSVIQSLQIIPFHAHLYFSYFLHCKLDDRLIKLIKCIISKPEHSSQLYYLDWHTVTSIHTLPLKKTRTALDSTSLKPVVSSSQIQFSSLDEIACWENKCKNNPVGFR